MRITNNCVFFWGSEFSNFYEVVPKLQFMDGEFSTSEQIFMFLKATHFKDGDAATLILNSTTPQQAKKFGRLVHNFDNVEWEKVRENYMFEAVYTKFSQNVALREKITDPCYDGMRFVEAHPYDNIWGIGMGERHPDLLQETKWGLNLLGKTINKVREVILDEYGYYNKNKRSSFF